MSATIAPDNPARSDSAHNRPTDRKRKREIKSRCEKIGSFGYAPIKGDTWELLIQNMSEYEKLLNGRQLLQLGHEYLNWKQDEQKKVRSQLKHVPNHARRQWLRETFTHERRRQENSAARSLFDFLSIQITNDLKWLDQIAARYAQFRHVMAKVGMNTERERLILEFARDLGASESQLRGDDRAFNRWFDEEAVTDRYLRRVGETELKLSFALQRLGEVVSTIIQISMRLANEESKGKGVTSDDRIGLDKKLSFLWGRLNVEELLQRALIHDGDHRILIAALRCIRKSISHVPGDFAKKILDKKTLIFVHRAALDSSLDVWVQCEALTITEMTAGDKISELLERRLRHPQGGDDMFVRRHAVRLLTARIKSNSREMASDRILETLVNDPSEFVRQQVAEFACHVTTSGHDRLAAIILNDDSHRVRAAGLVAGFEHHKSFDASKRFLSIVELCLQRETNEFVLRTAMFVAESWLARFIQQELFRSPADRAEAFESYRNNILPAIRNQEIDSPNVTLRRWAAMKSEKIRVLLDDNARLFLQRISDKVKRIKPGKSKWYSKRILEGVDRQVAGRVLATLAQDDFGYDVRVGWFGVRITRGFVFGFRLWRLVFEMLNTATDKRQAFKHTIGRISSARLRAPSQIMGELSQTKVPGEPVTMAGDGTWRPFLPLMDDFVSVLNMSWLWPRKVRFYTSQGITTVAAPTFIWTRIMAAVKITFQFAKYANLRNWDDHASSPAAYVKAMRKIGFKIKLAPHEPSVISTSVPTVNQKQADISVTRFFTATPILIPLAGTPILGAIGFKAVWKYIQQYTEYFSSAFENTLEQLVVFSVIVLLLVILKHLVSNIVFRISRRKIPLSIGGWGTRGKSGTERLKAALIGAMGHGLVSKTTGCEAMFIHADPYGEPLEMPLFRPYDKATIWEHRNIIALASKLKPSVFLWECMGLTPSYVDVLQRQWTCDNLATITNTYPDHEDLQGPTGFNVATTISGFVPRNSRLFTTEQQMKPLIDDRCRRADTSIQNVGWLESGLITDDVQERFPYTEHPDNIALVAAMANELGCEYDFALKAMADYLVPDLGVLKTYPISNIRNRFIEFTNGMSANERFGCIGNWKRIGYETQDARKEPGTWISAVVNNRADRVPRSRVFAQILVNDIEADRFFIIGNNLKGLQGFIWQAWSERAKQYTLVAEGEGWQTDQALEILEKTARSFRQPTEPDHVRDQVIAMTASLLEQSTNKSSIDIESVKATWDDANTIASKLSAASIDDEVIESVVAHQKWLRRSLKEYTELKNRIERAGSGESEKLNSRFIDLLETWFRRKLVVIDNYDASGEDVIRTIVDETPPGFTNRVMGLQNIKGTGLDFVYRFQAWDTCHEACEAITSNQMQSVHRGLQVLATMPVFGQLCEKKISDSLYAAKRNPIMQRADIHSEIENLETRLESAKAESNIQNEDSARQRSEISKWVINSTEQFLDITDAVRRRNRADNIYKDLANERIGRQRAILELRKINKRQKGGWLTTQLSKDN